MVISHTTTNVDLISMLTSPNSCIEHTIFEATALMNTIISCGESSDAQDEGDFLQKIEVATEKTPPRISVSPSVKIFEPRKPMPEGDLSISWVCKSHGSVVEHWNGTLLLSSAEAQVCNMRRMGWIECCRMLNVEKTTIDSVKTISYQTAEFASNFFESQGSHQTSVSGLLPSRQLGQEVILLQNVLVVPEYRGLGLALYMVDQAIDIGEDATVILDASVTDLEQESTLTKSPSLSKLTERSFNRTPSLTQVRKQIQRERSMTSTSTNKAAAHDYYGLLGFSVLSGNSMYMVWNGSRTRKRVVREICPHLFVEKNE